MNTLLENPEHFKAELKDKWLNYYKVNCSWLKQLVNTSECWVDSVKYKEEELKKLEIDIDYNPCRPESRFILGVISTLEPQVHILLSYLVCLNDDPDCIINSLGLDFDPEIELKKRAYKQTQPQIQTDFQHLNQIKEEIKT
jgi:hypothetical protein